MSLATYSDWTYAAALVIYVGALLLHLVQLSGRVGRKELVTAGAPVQPAETTAPPPSERFGRMGVSLTVLGAIVHLTSLALRGIAVERVPWGNMYEFGSSICLVAVVAWLVVLRREPSAQRLGGFVLLPIVILLFVTGTLLYTQAAPLIPPLQSYWIVIHVSAAIIATGVLLLSGVASMLYLIRSGREDRPSRLPASDVLDRLAYRSAVFAFPVWTFAIITGAVWAETAWGRYWGWDPKETVAFVSWVIYAGYLHARATAGWRRRRAAWVNVAGFTTMVFNLFFVNLVVAGLHSYAGV